VPALTGTAVRKARAADGNEEGVIHVVAVAGAAVINAVRWVDPLAHRTGVMTLANLARWIESPENPLIFVGTGIWMARLLVIRDQDDVPEIVVRRDGTIDHDPFAHIPSYDTEW
jgi:hypothetical protein